MTAILNLNTRVGFNVEVCLMAAITCYKLHSHNHQKACWILGIYLVFIFREKFWIFLQTRFVGKFK